MNAYYSFVSSLLFLLCATVQTNDPDPAFWIATYLIGGPLLVLLARPGFLHPSTATHCLTLWIAALVALAAYLAAALRVVYLAHSGGDHHLDDSLLWQLLEHELGRELGGTLALIVHACIVRVLLVSTINDGAQGSGKSRIATLVAALGVGLVGAVALVWFQFQSAMTVRYQQDSPHCSGALSPSSQQ
jgi:hypothetical protein